MNWKMLSLTLASLIGIGGIVGITVLVMKHDQSTDLQMRDAPRSHDAAAERSRRARAECREVAQSRVNERTGEVLKDSAVGALIGAGTGSAGGAIADGGSGAGKGAAIGGVVGAVGGALYGMNKNNKEAIFKRAYDDCMRARL
jgi:uncharacterized protein YcfJ